MTHRVQMVINDRRVLRVT